MIAPALPHVSSVLGLGAFLGAIGGGQASKGQLCFPRCHLPLVRPEEVSRPQIVLSFVFALPHYFRQSSRHASRVFFHGRGHPGPCTSDLSDGHIFQELRGYGYHGQRFRQTDKKFCKFIGTPIGCLYTPFKLLTHWQIVE